MTKPTFDSSSFTKEEIKKTLYEVRHPIDVAVYGLGNYFNIAGIIRTAHSFLVRDIYLIDVESSNDPFYEKGTMGNHKYENIIKMSMDEFIAFVEANPSKNLISFERRPGLLSPKSIYSYSYPENPILLFGSEKSGVPDQLLSVSKDMVCIPQYGLNNDLNVATAFGIVVYDWLQKTYRS